MRTSLPSSPLRHNLRQLAHTLSWQHRIAYLCVCILVGTMTSVQAQTPNDVLVGQQTYLRRIQLDQAWQITDALSQSAQPMTIAVIAQGFDLTHPDLQGIWFTNTNDPINGRDDDNNGFPDDNQGWDFVGNPAGALLGQGYVEEDNIVQSRNASSARTGTHVAGIIAALRNNQIGIAGIARNVRILPIRIGTDDSTQQATARLADAIRYAVMMGAKIIVLTTSTTDTPFAAYRAQEQEAINTAVRQGTLVFAPAGLTTTPQTLLLDETTFPAGYDNVITVGASASDNTRMVSARVGNRVMVYAPGEAIVSTLPNNQYGAITGAEQATAIAAGVAALVWQANPTWSPQQVALQVESTSDNTLLPQQSERSALAYGQVNALRAVTANRGSGASVPALGISDVIQFSLADNVQGNPLTAVFNASTARLSVRIKNYQSALSNITVQLLPASDSALVVPVDASVVRSIPTLGAQQTRSVEFLVQLTPRAFETNFLQGDILVVIRAGNYVQYVPLRVPIRASLDGGRGLVVANRTEFGTVSTADASRTIRFINSATTTQTISGITLSGAQASEFTLLQVPTFPLQLAPGAVQTCTVALRATSSTVLGLRQATLNIRTADSVYASAVVGVRASAPLSSAFGWGNPLPVVVMNSTITSTAVITIPVLRTSTTVTLSIDSLRTDGGEFTFAAGFNTTQNIPATGAILRVPIVLSPRSAGLKTAVLRLQSAGVADTRWGISSLAMQPDANGVAVLSASLDRQMQADDEIRPSSVAGASNQTESVTVFNVSTGTITITGLAFSGLGAGDCSAVQALPISIAPGQSTNINLRVTPSRVGEIYTRVAVQYRTTTSIVPVSLASGTIVWQAPTSRLFTTAVRSRADIISAGAGLMYPSLIAVFPDRNTGYQLFFGGRVGVRTTDNIVLTNPTSSSATIAALTFSDASYRVISALPKTLAPNATDTITVQYTPTTTAFNAVQVNAEMRVGSNTLRDTALIQPANVAASYISANAGGNQPNLVALFPTTIIGDSAFALTAPSISNNGTTSLQLSTSIIGTHASEFQILRLAQSLSGTLTAGASDSLVVRFVPRTAGVKTAVIIVQAGNTTLRYQVSARAVERPQLSIQASAVNLGSIGDGEEFVRAIGLSGQNLTSSIVVNVSGHEALFAPLSDTVRYLRSYQVQPNDDGTFNDSLRILAAPQLQPDTLLGGIQIVSGTASAQVSISATSRPTLLPRIRSIDVVTFDTVQTQSPATRSIAISAVNLTQDIVITLPANVTLEANGYALTRSGRIPASTFDSVWVLRWTPPRMTLAQLRSLDANTTVIPYRDTVRIVSGTQQRLIPLNGAIAPAPELIADPTVNLTPILTGARVSTTISISAVQLATGSTIQLVMSPDDTDSIRVMRFVVGTVQGQAQLADTMQITLPAGATLITTTITVQYQPIAVEQKTGSIFMQAQSIRGDTLNSSFNVLGTALPRPAMLATTQGIEYGTVQIFSNTPRLSNLLMTTVTDTVRWRIMGGEVSPFSLEIATQKYQKSGVFIPNEFNRVDTSVVVWFEPLEERRYLDTLRFTSSEFGVYDIILGGTSSTVTSIGYTRGASGSVQIVPSIVDDEMYILTKENLQGSTKIEFFSILGQSMMTYRMENLAPGQYRIPILKQQMPRGLVLWRITKSENTVFSGRIFIR